MGKPYESELAQLGETYRWSLSLDATPLAERIRAIASSPLLVVASGGSQTTAELITDLHHKRFGQLSKSETPLLAAGSIGQLKSGAILLVSARGQNPDILGIARLAVESEPQSLIAICASKDSRLSKIIRAFNKGFCFEFELPSGRDGFLATNSLVALSTVALSAYGYSRDQLPSDFESIFDRAQLRRKLTGSRTERSFFECKYLVVLYGADTKSAAVDLESKLVEAGLVSAQISDYRNFAHGRHHWLAKNSDTAVIALASGPEIDIAEWTLELLPKRIPQLLISTKLSGPPSWLPLQASIFSLVAEYGRSRNIDPGRPGVPEFGRRIYHLNVFSRSEHHIGAVAIARKLRAFKCDSVAHSQELRKAFSALRMRFERARFDGVVLDYDGTICDDIDRFGAIPVETAKVLTRVTAAGFLLGVATGRGKSVKKALRNALPKRHWEQVWVAYYNGGIVARLDDARQPNISGTALAELERASEVLRDLKVCGFEISTRPHQITVESSKGKNVRDIWFRVLQCLQRAGLYDIKVLMSTRSVDVVCVGTTKVRLLEAMKEIRPGSTFLCIGDRPLWPGNDAELLAHDFSLSVDEVDGSPETVWNLAPAGKLGAAALRYYLGRLKFGTRHFRIDFGAR